MRCGSIEEMRARAGEGDVGAMVELGVSLLYGYGAEKDYVEAFVNLQDAAVRGDGEAQLHLGRMYENGWGIKQDLWTAMNLYRRSYRRKTAGSRKALGDIFDKIIDPVQVTGRLTISRDFGITACCSQMKEYMRMGRVIPFEDDDGVDFYMSNMNREVKIHECPYCGCRVEHVRGAGDCSPTHARRR